MVRVQVSGGGRGARGGLTARDLVRIIRTFSIGLFNKGGKYILQFCLSKIVLIYQGIMFFSIFCWKNTFYCDIPLIRGPNYTGG